MPGSERGEKGMITRGLASLLPRSVLFPVLLCVGISLCAVLAPGAQEALLARADQSEAGPKASTDSGASKRKYKILHVMSYHSPWEWTDDLTRGFMDELSGVEVEYLAFQMDTKRKSSEEWKQSIAAEARNLIDTWKPDLVYTTDDNAQKYVAGHYVNRA
jgi:hypothetical protein